MTPDTRHTEGPWFAVEHGPYNISIEYNREIDGSMSAGSIAVVDGKRGDANRANARLIAACPTMSELIERAIMGDESPTYLNPLSDEWQEQAKAIIAAAKGERP